MKLSFAPTEYGKFVERINRFVASVELNGKEYHAHIATSGRLGELLVPGAVVLLEKSANSNRRTAYSLRAVLHFGVWVSIDAQVPNKLMEKILRNKSLAPFMKCDFVRREPAFAGGRFDFLLTKDAQPVYIEVKSVTLVEKGVALFPDAPTVRGSRHLGHLASLSSDGIRCSVCFIIQRDDAISFAPNALTDPHFAVMLRKAASAGVEIYAYSCNVSPCGIELQKRLPVMI